MSQKVQGKFVCKKLFAIWVPLLLFFFLVISFQVVIPVHAAVVQPYKVVQIVFPRSETYDSNQLTLNVTFPVGGLKYTLTYALDGNDQGSIPWSVYNPNNELHVVYQAVGSVNLPPLSPGSHHIEVTLQVDVHQNGPNPPNGAFHPISPGSSDYQGIWTDNVDFTIAPINAHDLQPSVTDSNNVELTPKASATEEPKIITLQPTLNQAPATRTVASGQLPNIQVFATIIAAVSAVIAAFLYIIKNGRETP